MNAPALAGVGSGPARFTLAAIGVVSLLRGWSYVGPSPLETPPQLALVDELVSLSVYGAVWLAAGFVALVASMWRAAKPWAIGSNLAVNALWFASFMYGWIFDEIERSWVTGITYGLLAWLIYREGTRRDPIHVHLVGGEQ